MIAISGVVYISQKMKNGGDTKIHHIIRSNDDASSSSSLQGSWVKKQMIYNEKHPVVKVSKNAITKNGIESATLAHSVVSTYDHRVWSHKITTEGKCTAQKSSGRCWIFACMNVMRIEMMRKYKGLKDDFELSQSFVFFYDKLERANYFLETIIDTCEEPLDSRLVSHLLQNGNLMSDGGQWDMLVNVVTKYGVCPKAAFPDSHAAKASRPMNLFLRQKLRAFAVQLRSMEPSDKKAMRAAKLKMMEKIYQALVIFLGQPPSTFEWTYPEAKDQKGAAVVKSDDTAATKEDGDNKTRTFRKRHTGLTPLRFYKDFVPFDMDAKISLINDPRNDYFKMYTVKMLGNVVGGHVVRYINVPIDVLKSCAATTIADKNLPVWFGCDVGKHKSNDLGAMDTGVRDLDSAFPGLAGVKMTKEQRLRYGHSLMTHAMVNVFSSQNHACL